MGPGRHWPYASPSIAIGALPDADPNMTPPAPARVFDASGRTGRGVPAGAIHWTLDMDTAGTADVTLWIQDRTSTKWFSVATELAVGDKAVFEMTGAPGAKIFFQLTNPATFATVVVRAVEVP